MPVYFIEICDVPPVVGFPSGILKGYLLKKDKKLCRFMSQTKTKWKRKFCLLFEHRIYFYENENSTGTEKGSGFIDLSIFDGVREFLVKEPSSHVHNHASSPLYAKLNAFALMPCSNKRLIFYEDEIVFGGESAFEIREWTNQIEQSFQFIESKKAKKFKRNGLMGGPMSNQIKLLPSQDFSIHEKYSESGDQPLFHNVQQNCSFQLLPRKASEEICTIPNQSMEKSNETSQFNTLISPFKKFINGSNTTHVVNMFQIMNASLRGIGSMRKVKSKSIPVNSFISCEPFNKGDLHHYNTSVKDTEEVVIIEEGPAGWLDYSSTDVNQTYMYSSSSSSSSSDADDNDLISFHSFPIYENTKNIDVRLMSLSNEKINETSIAVAKKTTSEINLVDLISKLNSKISGGSEETMHYFNAAKSSDQDLNESLTFIKDTNCMVKDDKNLFITTISNSALHSGNNQISKKCSEATHQYNNMKKEVESVKFYQNEIIEQLFHIKEELNHVQSKLNTFTVFEDSIEKNTNFPFASLKKSNQNVLKDLTLENEQADTILNAAIKSKKKLRI